MGYSLSINELVEKIILVSNKTLRLKNDLSKPDITALSLDCSKANKEIKWFNSSNFMMHLKNICWANEVWIILI